MRAFLYKYRKENQMNNTILSINENLAKFAERVPAKGMHLSYLDKATELMELYGDALSIMEDERTPENETKVEAIAKEIEEIVR